MSGANNSLRGSVAVVENGDVTVERRIHPSDRNKSFVTLVVRNTGTVDLSIRVQEGVSDAVENAAPIESLDQDRSSWWFDGNRIIHEHQVTASDDRAIVYEIQLSGGAPEMELSQPSIVEVEPIDEVEDGVAADDDATEDALWRGGTSTEDPRATASERVPETGSPPSETPEMSNLVERLVAELESADDDELEPLKAQLLPGRSERVRLDHFRSRVDDLEAYVKILEAFLDEYGRPDDVVDDTRERFDENERELEAHSSEIERLEETVQERERELEGAIRRFEAGIGRLDREFERLHDQVEEWHATQRQIASALSGEGVEGKPSE